MRIKIFYESEDFRLKKVSEIRNQFVKVIESEDKSPGDLNFIFTGDENLMRINREFLNHDYYTDVITFDYCKGRKVNGEVYISIDTVRLNAINYNVSLESEVIRVMIHGMLHLLGYDDRTEEERKRMKEKEDYWLGIVEGK